MANSHRHSGCDGSVHVRGDGAASACATMCGAGATVPDFGTAGVLRACMVSGPAAEVLAEQAQEQDVDFVVVGSRGRTLVGSMLLGGISHRLIHICKKPILIVH